MMESHSISENDMIVSNISMIEKKIEQKRKLLIKFEKDATTYIYTLKRLELFLSKTQKSILKRLSKYRFKVITRKVENILRKRILSTFVPLLNIIKDEYNSINPENNNGADFMFINNIIIRFRRNIVQLGTKQFNEYLVHVA